MYWVWAARDHMRSSISGSPMGLNVWVVGSRRSYHGVVASSTVEEDSRSSSARSCPLYAIRLASVNGKLTWGDSVQIGSRRSRPLPGGIGRGQRGPDMIRWGLGDFSFEYRVTWQS